MPFLRWLCCAAVGLLPSGALLAQSLIFSDAFNTPGTTVDVALWPGSYGTRVEGSETFFGPTNRYLLLSGAGTKALSANYGSRLGGQPSTFAFDFYEPDTATNSVILGYAATTSDINAAGAFIRFSVGEGKIDLNATDGTAVTASGNSNYPLNTPLTFSLVLNDSTNALPWRGSTLPPRTLEFWYAAPNQEPVHALTVSAATSVRSPACVGFRTWSTSPGALAYFDNVQLFDTLVLGTNVLIPPENVARIIPPRPFVHPSLYNTAQEIERIRYRVLNEPASVAAQGWNQLLGSSYASLTYVQVPYSNVVVMGSGTTPSETQFRADAHAARGNAIRWTITGDSRYRDKARQILNDWANVFTLMTPASGTSASQIELECAWAAPIWVAAADLIRYYDNGSAGWSAAEISKFDGMLNYMYTQAAKSATRENNWGASAAIAMITIGNYQANRTRFNAGIQTWKDRLVGINKAVDSYNDDSIYEVCRDNIHPQYTLTVWAQAADVAWMHGIDLYGTLMETNNPVPQFARNLEYFAELFLGLRNHPCGTNYAYSFVGQQDRANAYEVGYNHYVVRQGLSSLVDYSNMVVTTCRPGGFDNHFPAWTTLTHGNLSAGIPVVTNLTLWNIAGGSAVRPIEEGETLNLRELTNGFGLAAELKGTFATMEFLTNGSRFAYSSNRFSTRLPRPGNHWLGVLPRVGVPQGTIPGDIVTRFIRVIDLPKGWKLRDFEAPTIPAWAAEEAGTFTVVSAGKGAAGGADQLGLVSAGITGDAQITAQLDASGLPAAGTMGIGFRELPTSGSRCVQLNRQGDQLVFSVRSSDGGTLGIVVSTNLTSNVWVRLTRWTNTFAASYSTNGISWMALGAAEVSMSGGVEVGMSASSGDAATTGTAVFRQVRVEPLRPGYAAWAGWMLSREGITLEASAPEFDADEDGLSNAREYLLGLDPLRAEAPSPVLQVESAATELVIRTVERANAGEWGRTFLFSTDLVNWSPVSPLSTLRLQDGGSTVLNEFRFAAPGARGFLKISYPWVP